MGKAKGRQAFSKKRTGIKMKTAPVAAVVASSSKKIKKKDNVKKKKDVVKAGIKKVLNSELRRSYRQQNIPPSPCTSPSTSPIPWKPVPKLDPKMPVLEAEAPIVDEDPSPDYELIDDLQGEGHLALSGSAVQEVGRPGSLEISELELEKLNTSLVEDELVESLEEANANMDDSGDAFEVPSQSLMRLVELDDSDLVPDMEEPAEEIVIDNTLGITNSDPVDIGRAMWRSIISRNNYVTTIENIEQQLYLQERNYKRQFIRYLIRSTALVHKYEIQVKALEKQVKPLQEELAKLKMDRIQEMKDLESQSTRQVSDMMLKFQDSVKESSKKGAAVDKTVMIELKQKESDRLINRLRNKIKVMVKEKEADALKIESASAPIVLVDQVTAVDDIENVETISNDSFEDGAANDEHLEDFELGDGDEELPGDEDKTNYTDEMEFKEFEESAGVDGENVASTVVVGSLLAITYGDEDDGSNVQDRVELRLNEIEENPDEVETQKLTVDEDMQEVPATSNIGTGTGDEKSFGRGLLSASEAEMSESEAVGENKAGSTGSTLVLYAPRSEQLQLSQSDTDGGHITDGGGNTRFGNKQNASSYKRGMFSNTEEEFELEVSVNPASSPTPSSKEKRARKTRKSDAAKELATVSEVGHEAQQSGSELAVVNIHANVVAQLASKSAAEDQTATPLVIPFESTRNFNEAQSQGQATATASKRILKKLPEPLPKPVKKKAEQVDMELNLRRYLQNSESEAESCSHRQSFSRLDTKRYPLSKDAQELDSKKKGFVPENIPIQHQSTSESERETKKKAKTPRARTPQPYSFSKSEVAAPGRKAGRPRGKTQVVVTSESDGYFAHKKATPKRSTISGKGPRGNVNANCNESQTQGATVNTNIQAQQGFQNLPWQVQFPQPGTPSGSSAYPNGGGYNGMPQIAPVFHQPGSFGSATAPFNMQGVPFMPNILSSYGGPGVGLGAYGQGMTMNFPQPGGKNPQQLPSPNPRMNNNGGQQQASSLGMNNFPQQAMSYYQPQNAHPGMNPMFQPQQAASAGMDSNMEQQNPSGGMNTDFQQSGMMGNPPMKPNERTPRNKTKGQPTVLSDASQSNNQQFHQVPAMMGPYQQQGMGGSMMPGLNYFGGGGMAGMNAMFQQPNLAFLQNQPPRKPDPVRSGDDEDSETSNSGS